MSSTSIWSRAPLDAIALITRLRLARAEISDDRFAAASMLFPVIGFAVGLILTSVAHLVDSLPRLAASVLLVVLWEVLGTPSRSSTPAVGLTVALLIKAGLLSATGSFSHIGLLFAPILGRWSLVVLAVGARNADRTGQKFSPAVTFNEFAIASVIALGIVFALGQLVGLLLIIVTGSVTLVLRLLFHRWQGGVTWATVVAGLHAVEIAALATLALLPDQMR